MGVFSTPLAALRKDETSQSRTHDAGGASKCSLVLVLAVFADGIICRSSGRANFELWRYSLALWQPEARTATGSRKEAVEKRRIVGGVDPIQLVQGRKVKRLQRNRQCGPAIILELELVIAVPSQ